MNLSPSLLKGALLDAQQCNGMAPTTSQMLISEGWAEWVDYEFGTPIDENDPRSLMRLTAAGHIELEALEGTLVDQPIATLPVTVQQPSARKPQPSGVSFRFSIGLRARAAI
ncbi:MULTISPECIES: hypothetical protein [unclassified Variovorax]|uniref:hypothetical protein n=1 Tax=unclassified Variovorax TaxID=663243 RepID=UPI001BD4693C|nr:MULTISPECIES: hypothetical protein [unclassified Variovorax]